MSTNKAEHYGHPEGVGIVAMEVYFPSQYVDQAELETFDAVSTGKYTIGLEQEKMGFCTDIEDIHSLCLTVVQNLMERYNIKYESIGRLEVGTETVLDKSKSVKTVLMQLFEKSGNTNIEGVDTSNACYGGTNALFNSINWIESSYWDKRYALVVMGDIAVYATGNARCTGGAGAVALLLGENAPLVFDRGCRATHMQHVYDFYKPNMHSEYPVVDGKLSIQCYLRALDKCCDRFFEKLKTKGLTKGDSLLDSADAFVFHSPYCKLVKKSLARIFFNDFRRSLSLGRDPSKYASLEAFGDMPLEQTYTDKALETACIAASSADFLQKTEPSLLLAKQIGNMYTPSVYGGLVSFLISCPVEQLPGCRCVLFSYGSGLASSMFSLHISKNATSELQKLLEHLSDIRERLDWRTKVSPLEFDQLMKLRETTAHKAPYEPDLNIKHLFPGTYYLTAVDAQHRRQYERIPPATRTSQTEHDQRS